MDLSQPVFYRRFPLNNAGIAVSGGPNVGCMLESVNYSNVQGVGYTEKRALGDGNDAGDVYLTGRRIQLKGTLYGASPGALFDLKQDLLAAFNPTLAYAESPYDFGYQPLEWYEPTAREDFGVAHLRHVYCNVRPVALPQFDVVRDRIGSPSNGKGLALEWQAMVEAKDPRIYVDPETGYFFDVNAASSGLGTFTNRGDYPAPMDVLLDVGVHTDTRYWHFVGGGAALTLKMPPTTTGNVIRYDGALKIVTLFENNIEYLRMDLLDLDNEQQHPLIQPGETNWSWTRNTTPPPTLLSAEPGENTVVTASSAMPKSEGVNPLVPGLSRFWYSEAFS